MEATIVLDGRTYTVALREENGVWIADVDGDSFPVRGDRDGLRSVVEAAGDVFHVDTRNPRCARIDGRDAPFQITALSGVAGAADPSAGSHGPIQPPMTGKLESLLVEAGQEVEAGDVLFVLEAMKMRNEIKASAAGRIASIGAAPGDAVDTGTTILVLEPL